MGLDCVHNWYWCIEERGQVPTREYEEDPRDEGDDGPPATQAPRDAQQVAQHQGGAAREDEHRGALHGICNAEHWHHHTMGRVGGRENLTTL
ncbi:hypothetical protein CEXT_689931 [Caerostris extrusa]|uniref:Uncharacterized protein n=1 Tax=Caerostris extrusa TaxID=172846 RepID=A0AAV4TC20_CAEEX|nr:hypothetical protein CEXT_689931 [Caerostris extrusa]